MAANSIKFPKREFSIHKKKLKSGEELCIPMTRVKSKVPFLKNPWGRIICIYGVYVLQDIDFEPIDTIDCEAHIKGYIKQLEEACSKQIFSTEIQLYETTD